MFIFICEEIDYVSFSQKKTWESQDVMVESHLPSVTLPCRFDKKFSSHFLKQRFTRCFFKKISYLINARIIQILSCQLLGALLWLFIFYISYCSTLKIDVILIRKDNMIQFYTGAYALKSIKDSTGTSKICLLEEIKKTVSTKCRQSSSLFRELLSLKCRQGRTNYF